MSRLFLALSVAVLMAATAPAALAQPAPDPATEVPATEPPAQPPTPAEPPPKAEAEAPAPAAPATPSATETGERLTPDQFRQHLVGVPLCGIPPSGPLAQKILCTVHLADGIAVVAGSGVLVRGLWEIADGQICRRSKDDPLERRRCVTYVKVSDGRYRNSDGVELCLGPCGQ